MATSGSHFGGWRHPSSESKNPFDLAVYAQLARKAEAAKLDMIFIADKLSIDDLYGGNFATTVRHRPFLHAEPVTLLAALAALTSRICLGATVSTTYTEPYTIARQFAAIDHFSNGRAAWNAVTSVNDGEARNFSREEHLDHATRYSRAAEYIDVAKLLWDTVGSDAITPDKADGTYGDPTKVHYADHRGQWFQVQGPLNVPDIRDRVRGSKGRFAVVIADAMARGLTMGELGREYARGLAFAKFVGSPVTIADRMEEWVTGGAADGFVVMPSSMPLGFDRFLEDVVPELQRRGIFRKDYAGTTLRDHLGLTVPPNRFEVA